MNLKQMSGGERLQAVKTMIQGHELDIYNRMPEMSEAVRRRPNQVPDPKDGSGNTVFRIKNNGDCYLNGHGYMDVIDVCAHIYGLSKMKALDLVVELWCGGWAYTNLDAVPEPQKRAEPALSEEEVNKRKEALRKMWMRSVPASESREVRKYLEGRGLSADNLPSALRGLRKALHVSWEVNEETGERTMVKTWWPALLGIYHDKHGKPLSLHRIFMSGNGKAPVEKAKKIMSPPGDMRGGAIRLDEPKILEDEHGKFGVLALCEGIETALAVRQATGVPTWACYSNTLLEQVVIPEGICQVVIFADKDQKGGGQESAYKLMARLENQGIQVTVEIPPLEIPEGEKSVDWLDVLNLQGPEAFPWTADPIFDVRLAA